MWPLMLRSSCRTTCHRWTAALLAVLLSVAIAGCDTPSGWTDADNPAQPLNTVWPGPLPKQYNVLASHRSEKAPTVWVVISADPITAPENREVATVSVPRAVLAGQLSALKLPQTAVGTIEAREGTLVEWEDQRKVARIRSIRTSTGWLSILEH